MESSGERASQRSQPCAPPAQPALGRLSQLAGNMTQVAPGDVSQSDRMPRSHPTTKALSIPRVAPPDLGSQFEDLLIEVWRQEEFERKHPFTCEVMREPSRSRTVAPSFNADRSR